MKIRNTPKFLIETFLNIRKPFKSKFLILKRFLSLKMQPAKKYLLQKFGPKEAIVPDPFYKIKLMFEKLISPQLPPTERGGEPIDEMKEAI